MRIERLTLYAAFMRRAVYGLWREPVIGPVRASAAMLINSARAATAAAKSSPDTALRDISSELVTPGALRKMPGGVRSWAYRLGERRRNA
ncbi:MAG: hypothetical protein ACT4P0_11625 [Panacagrimonas sp.]